MCTAPVGFLVPRDKDPYALSTTVLYCCWCLDLLIHSAQWLGIGQVFKKNRIEINHYVLISLALLNTCVKYKCICWTKENHNLHQQLMSQNYKTDSENEIKIKKLLK